MIVTSIRQAIALLESRGIEPGSLRMSRKIYLELSRECKAPVASPVDDAHPTFDGIRIEVISHVRN